MILEWNILHRVDSLICTPQNSNHLRSHSRAIIALDHSRLGLENKSGRIICDRQVLYKILPTNLGECINQPFILFITSEVKQNYEALYLTYKPLTGCSISQFFKTNCTHSMFRTINRGLFAKPFKKIPKSPIRLAGSHFCQAPNLQWELCESV